VGLVNYKLDLELQVGSCIRELDLSYSVEVEYIKGLILFVFIQVK
jgi:hypothetical protein